MDKIDAEILNNLQVNGRITNSELAKRVGLSAPSVLERVRKLEESGVISGYSARINPDKVGRGTTCFVAVSLALHQQDSIKSFKQEIDDIPEVLECFHITGEEDYLLRVTVRDMQHYRDLLLNRLTKIPGLSKLKTMVVLSQIKIKTELEVDPSALDQEGNNRIRGRNNRKRGSKSK
ncbi:MAG TPA: Lrp/AsnC family transcriptional regulator [Acidobacteriota bacterium]|nr:Lrp/AsnC family transcriptional regulator [Acidobacteriota bacterium]